MCTLQASTLCVYPAGRELRQKHVQLYRRECGQILSADLAIAMGIIRPAASKTETMRIEHAFAVECRDILKSITDKTRSTKNIINS